MVDYVSTYLYSKIEANVSFQLQGGHRCVNLQAPITLHGQHCTGVFHHLGYLDDYLINPGENNPTVSSLCAHTR